MATHTIEQHYTKTRPYSLFVCLLVLYTVKVTHSCLIVLFFFNIQIHKSLYIYV